MITLTCTRGNATLKALSVGKWERPMILTGKRRRFDHLHWSLYGYDSNGEYQVALQGLYRGSYADALCTVKELYKALGELRLVECAERLKNACDANDIPVV